MNFSYKLYPITVTGLTGVPPACILDQTHLYFLPSKVNCENIPSFLPFFLGLASKFHDRF